MKRLLAGTHAVDTALRTNPKALAVVYAEEGPGAPGAVVALAEKLRVPIERKSRTELDALAGEVRHQGVLAIAGEYAYADLDELVASLPGPLLLVALDQITDPHNLGAIVRSALAFGADAVITLKDRAAPVSPAAVRASAGATERMRICRVTNLARTLAGLRDAGFHVAGLAGEGAADLNALPFGDAGLVLVVGSEGDGLRRLVREQCDTLVRIPMTGPMESLNASVAAGVALYAAQAARPARSTAP